jgi:hypothetical protein
MWQTWQQVLDLWLACFQLAESFPADGVRVAGHFQIRVSALIDLTVYAGAAVALVLLRPVRYLLVKARLTLLLPVQMSASLKVDFWVGKRYLILLCLSATGAILVNSMLCRAALWKAYKKKNVPVFFLVLNLSILESVVIRVNPVILTFMDMVGFLFQLMEGKKTTGVKASRFLIASITGVSSISFIFSSVISLGTVPFLMTFRTGYSNSTLEERGIALYGSRDTSLAEIGSLCVREDLRAALALRFRVLLDQDYSNLVQFEAWQTIAMFVYPFLMILLL